MTKDSRLSALRAFLEAQGAGSVSDTNKVASLLSDSWDALEVDDYTNMCADKLWRIEDPTWQPPHLDFLIERHGATINGSSRATVYTWRVDLQARKASIIGEKRRQLYTMDKRLDVKPIAESLAKAILTRDADERLRTQRDGSIRLNMGQIIPETNKQTTGARRSRLRHHLDELLAPHGWRPARPNVYVREDLS